MLLTRDVHYPKIEAWRRAAETYRQTYGEDYFSDLFEVHADLGLGFVSEGTRVMASLTPVKEREIVIMGDVDDYARPGAFSGPFKRALFRALDTFINRMGVTAFNVWGRPVRLGRDFPSSRVWLTEDIPAMGPATSVPWSSTPPA
jgi:hypothetical protein